MRAAALVALLCVTGAMAQSPAPTKSAPESLPAVSENKGAWDFGVWAGGGHTVSGGVEGVGVANAGFRIGKILTGQHGSGWLKGNFEYAIDLIPMFILTGVPDRSSIGVLCAVNVPNCRPPFAGSGTAYGGGLDPFAFKWNFTSGHRISPYIELAGGVLFTNKEIPFGTSDVNFMPQASIGMNIFTRERRAISLDFRYMHISNAGIASPNPGFNTLQGQIGFHWFK